MNERFLFRGKRLTTYEWIYGGHWHQDHPPIDFIANETGDTVIIPSTIGQCTGLRDKTGKLIFEGDIVKITNDSGIPDGSHAVEWGNGFFAKIYDCTCYIEKLDHDAMIEVIGTIHDNQDPPGKEATRDD